MSSKNFNSFKDFQSDQIQASSRKLFTAHYAFSNSDLNLTPVTGTTNRFIFQIINSLIESWGVRLTCFDCKMSSKCTTVIDILKTRSRSTQYSKSRCSLPEVISCGFAACGFGLEAEDIPTCSISTTLNQYMRDKTSPGYLINTCSFLPVLCWLFSYVLVWVEPADLLLHPFPFLLLLLVHSWTGRWMNSHHEERFGSVSWNCLQGLFAGLWRKLWKMAKLHNWTPAVWQKSTASYLKDYNFMW